MEHLTCDNNMLSKLNKYKEVRYMSFAGNDIKFLPFAKKLKEVVCDYTDMIFDEKYKIVSHDVTTLKKKQISTIILNPQ
jgi:hypothetical protein